MTNRCGSGNILKIESLEIEARDSSVPLARPGSRELGKGIPPKHEICLKVFCWAVREYLPDCHKLL